MNNLSNHNHFFTEENSPVPLVPPDDAWAAMQAKLDRQQSGKKKRRGLLWMAPIGCGLLLLLLAVGGYWLWPTTGRQETSRQERIDRQTPAHAKGDSGATEKNTLQPPASLAGQQDSSAVQADRLTDQQQAESLRTDGTLHPAPSSPGQASGRRNGGRSSRYVLSGDLHQQPGSPAPPQSYNKTLFPSPGSADATGVEENSLRFTQVAGVHFHAPIRVQPFFSPQPGWLPEERSSKDSSGNKPARKWVVAAGLQLETPLPIYGGDAYFKDPRGRDRFYAPFIPGAWASISRQRHRFTGEFKPFSQALLPNEVFHTGAVITPNGWVYIGKHNIRKVFGLQFGLHYSYQLNQQWSVGAGLTGAAWQKALIRVDNMVDSGGNSSPWYGLKRSSLHELRAFQPGAALHVSYRQKNWEVMLQVETPFHSTVERGSIPVWARLGVRWRIWQSQAGTATRPAQDKRPVP